MGLILLFAIIVIGVAVGLISLVLRLLRAPIRLLFKVLLHIGAGFLALILINMAGALVGITVGVNLLNAAIVAVLGVPGAVLALLLTLLL